jgi:hypothetical protein
VCVCVCVRERDREVKGEREKELWAGVQSSRQGRKHTQKNGVQFLSRVCCEISELSLNFLNYKITLFYLTFSLSLFHQNFM